MLKNRKIAAVFGFAMLLPILASAQATISGVVRDASGAVLPGVTVEAASPALIEKVRTAVTDGTGQYPIENLRPGLYTVTFTLPGFSVVKREGIELDGSFTARSTPTCGSAASKKRSRSPGRRRWWTCRARASSA